MNIKNGSPERPLSLEPPDLLAEAGYSAQRPLRFELLYHTDTPVSVAIDEAALAAAHGGGIAVGGGPSTPTTTKVRLPGRLMPRSAPGGAPRARVGRAPCGRRSACRWSRGAGWPSSAHPDADRELEEEE